MCVESVCGVCAESVWDARFVFWCYGVLLCVVWCVLCVVCVVCGVCCVVCGVVCGAAWHAEKPPCASSKTSPCVGSKRFRVYRHTETF